MVKQYLQDIDVECFVHRGALGFSRPTLCVFHKVAEPCAPLLLALNELEAEGPEARRTITFRPSQRNKCIATLKLVLVAECDQLRVMCIECGEGTAKIAMTATGLAVLREAVSKWGQGAEDFGASPRHSDVKKKQFGPFDKASLELWFWGPTYWAP